MPACHEPGALTRIGELPDTTPGQQREPRHDMSHTQLADESHIVRTVEVRPAQGDARLHRIVSL